MLHINSPRCLTSSCPLWLHLHDICLYFFLFFFMHWLLSPWPSLTSITIRDLILLVAQMCSRCIPCVFSFAPRLYFLSLRVSLSLYPWLSQAGCGSGQPGLMVGNPAHSRGVETRWSLWSFSTQAILSMILWLPAVWFLWGLGNYSHSISLLCYSDSSHFQNPKSFHHLKKQKKPNNNNKTWL